EDEGDTLLSAFFFPFSKTEEAAEPFGFFTFFTAREEASVCFRVLGTPAESFRPTRPLRPPLRDGLVARLDECSEDSRQEELPDWAVIAVEAVSASSSKSHTNQKEMKQQTQKPNHKKTDNTQKQIVNKK